MYFRCGLLKKGGIVAPACAVASAGSSWGKRTARALAGSAAFAAVTFVVFLMLIPSAVVLAADPATITSLSVASGPTVGGAAVIITGTGFTGTAGASAVSFGGANAASYTVNSDTQISAVTPAHISGKVDVTVTAPGGASADTSADDYTFMTRYDQTDSRLSFSGAWAAFSTTPAWKGSYGRSAASGASVTIAFTGTRLDWIAMKGTTPCAADVYLDGALKATIDLSSATAAYQQNVWTTGPVSDGPHNVRIVRSSTSAAGKYLTIDAVDVLGSITGTGRVEQTDTRIAYGGTWGTYSTAGASGGSYTRASASGAAAIVDFNGTYLAWIATKGTTMGKAWVSLDGGAPLNIDLAAAATAYQQKVWNTGTLTSGNHEVKIWWDTTSAAGKYVSIDAFDVEGSLTQAYFLTRYEQTDPRFLFAGPWSTVTSTSASTGGYTIGGSGAGLTVNFTGTRLDWIATLGPNMGSADVSVDGEAAVLVELLSATYVYQQKVFSTGVLTSGKHVLEISWDEANPTGTYVSVDALDVAGSVPWELTLTATQAKWVEQRLSDLSYRPGAIDGVFDTKTRGAIIAFQKWEGLTRNGEVSAAVLTRLGTATRPKPTKVGATNPWIEVNKAKQVLLYCKDGAVVWTLPVSTGSASVGIVTPSGTFYVHRKTLETSPRYLPLYISTTLLAIHGYTNVPTYPASHGCVRTQIWDEDALQPLIAVGIYVYIY
jgi:IPT/TIG domain/L,D-transpeptidase catalytic domain/Putative peptidoglycan binding domain